MSLNWTPKSEPMSSIRAYTPSDRPACIAIFQSNQPKYFAAAELPLFAAWLDKPGLADYYVLEVEGEVVGCGGFYALPERQLANLAWGMVHAACHGRGYGRQLAAYRLELMQGRYPGYTLSLSTSQHTYGFYEKQGYVVKEVIRDGFGEGLDKYIMEKQ